MFDIKRALRVEKFFENFLRHSKGEWAGRPFVPARWQREKILRPLFGTVDEQGYRQYRTAYIEIPRKNGKSELAAGIALYLLCADLEESPEIYCAATNREQASIVFNVARDMVRMSPELLKFLRITDSAKIIQNKKNGGIYRVLTSNVRAAHGLNAHGIIVDEVHAQRTRDLIDVLTTSQGARRQPLTLYITTAGDDEKSICYELHKYAKSIQEGKIHDKSFFSFIAGIQRGEDWTDEKVWLKANPALGDFRSLEEMREKFNQARGHKARELAFRRFYLNEWVGASVAWLNASDWRECKIESNLPTGVDAFLGLDLSSTTDLTALAMVIPPRSVYERWTAKVFFFLPQRDIAERERADGIPYRALASEGHIFLTEGRVVDYKFILDFISRICDNYNIRAIAFDRWGSTAIVNELEKMKLRVVPYGQGYKDMGYAAKEFERLIVSHNIAIAANPILDWNASNVVVRLDPAGNIKPDKSKSINRIDGIVALCMAIGVATREITIDNDAQPKSVYDERGIFVI